MSDETLFTKIINGDIPADILFEDEHCICIKDIHPQAPTHVLVIPRKPLPRLCDATQEDKVLLGHLMLQVGEIARKLGIDEAFRVVINNGAGAGQQVFHLHLHILGNKTFDEGSLGMH
ncbi:histidine triad nucleotide-binding protein [Teredinibacter haidensis]|uniref:histidine triad nucleotide-binding protein n=1 Tax=Teredinibacter haidensis TaxID=2731755 RepID=UPI000948C395|nr:histidine triad nucleotide-binding protein [Teredinibacter haidensis]